MAEAAQDSYQWLSFALLTVATWGLYGVMLHNGQLAMADPVNGRYKAFLFVGVAYFLTAVLAPLALLVLKGASWTMPGSGMIWSLAAGIVGAIGAFGVLLAFGAKGQPTVVMSIVFAGAPVVNAIFAMLWHPPAGGWRAVSWPFYAGIVLAAVGACMVCYFRPPPARATPPAPAAVATTGSFPGQP